MSATACFLHAHAVSQGRFRCASRRARLLDTSHRRRLQTQRVGKAARGVLTTDAMNHLESFRSCISSCRLPAFAPIHSPCPEWSSATCLVTDLCIHVQQRLASSRAYRLSTLRSQNEFMLVSGPSNKIIFLQWDRYSASLGSGTRPSCTMISQSHNLRCCRPSTHVLTCRGVRRLAPGPPADACARPKRHSDRLTQMGWHPVVWPDPSCRGRV